MKAVRLLEYGGQLVFNDVPTPTIARDEVLVKVKSTAVNHLDLVKAAGNARQILPIDLPWIPGHEFSGVVEKIGSDIAAYAPGDVVFDLIGGDTQKRSLLVLKEGGHLVSATQPVSQEETARHRVSGEMMRLTPSADVLSRIARLLEEGTIRPDVASVYALQDAAQSWKDIAENLPGVHGMSPTGPGAARRRSHGKIVLRVA